MTAPAHPRSMSYPRISVITSSYNQGHFIARTIDSVLAQAYPDLEHIVVDGLSNDDTVDVLARYPHLKVIREKDTGQANAINKGFRHATGSILCFLNSDDTFEPGALLRVAQEIDPAAGRHVVMGRCRFIDEHDRFIGVEHPSAFESHARVLAIWKGYTIPQPAVFWTREVWDRCGPLDEHDHLVLDYDLFCRFTREYRIHTFDQVVANYRLHEASKTQGMDDQVRLQQAVQVSRRYWGPAWTPQGMALRASWAAFRFDRRGRAYRGLSSARAAWRDGAYGRAVTRGLPGLVLGPDVALAGVAAPVMHRVGGVLRRAMRPLRRAGATVHPQTAAWRDFRQVHVDGWAGPSVRVPFTRDAGRDEVLVVAGDAPLPLPAPLSLTILVPGGGSTTTSPAEDGTFRIEVPLAAVAGGVHEAEITSSTSVVPHDLWGNGDFRPLSFRLQQCDVRTVDSRGAT